MGEAEAEQKRQPRAGEDARAEGRHGAGHRGGRQGQGVRDRLGQLEDRKDPRQGDQHAGKQRLPRNIPFNSTSTIHIILGRKCRKLESNTERTPSIITKATPALVNKQHRRSREVSRGVYCRDLPNFSSDT